jgi:prepilin-type N-terminal cleavage/methylation domain-containing protein
MKNGFSLIELMISVFVIGILFSGIFKMSYQISTITQTSREQSVSLQYAQSEVENIRYSPWVAAPHSSTNHPTILQNTVSVSKQVPYTDDINILTVEISWDGIHGRTTNSLTTMVSRLGIGK